MASNRSLGVDAIALMDALGIAEAIIGGFDWGARTANVVAALWPGRCKAMVSVSGYLIGNPAAGQAPLPPPAELPGGISSISPPNAAGPGYDEYRRDFANLIWHTASPEWKFDDATFDRSARVLRQPRSCRHRDPQLPLAARPGRGRGTLRRSGTATRHGPVIAVPTITLEGDANGAPHPEPDAYRAKFSGKYEHRTIAGGIGHNLPHEAPQAFAQAVIDVDSY